MILLGPRTSLHRCDQACCCKGVWARDDHDDDDNTNYNDHIGDDYFYNDDDCNTNHNDHNNDHCYHMLIRANGRAWGQGENRELYSNQLTGQVKCKHDGDDDDADDESKRTKS